ncbi:phosphopantetheine-binding protein [Nocardioides humi]|uniref:Carrier domain-containing protein n=1 Tax=Nocardioides humi TaxID=449461 RepID=A0ABN2A9Y9_9ACTN|nr:phosphopantetheine-binding protein [Nocardioides humi]
MSTTLTADGVLADLAAAARLEIHEIDGEDTLFDLGIDSVRLMALVERWRGAGADIEFSELAENPTVAGVQRRLIPRIKETR